MNREKDEENKSRKMIPVLRKRAVIVIALLIVVVAGAAGLWFLRPTHRGKLTGGPVPTPDFDVAPTPMSDTVAHPGDLLITIPSEKLENARLKIEAATAQPIGSTGASGLRTTGTIEANAYKVVPIMPIAGGIVREVTPVLGDKVARGQKLATIFSTELSDAQTSYLVMLAEIEKHHQRYKRAEKLVEIGTLSREEFEEVNAEYKIEQARLTAARQRLLLLGMSGKQVDDMRDSNHMRQTDALISVEAPISGTILSRSINTGEVVTLGKELFRIADLSTVWVIGQIYEKDFAGVRVGSRAVITVPAYPGKSLAARVSYIDPRVEPQMRTAQIRVEVRNPGEMLKLGMFVDVIFGETPVMTGQEAVRVPRSAVQMIGEKQIVFVVTGTAGRFTQRNVSIETGAGEMVTINKGLSAGDRIVTEGSFLLRAESLKLDPSQLTTGGAAAQRGQNNPAGPNSPQSLQTDRGRTQSVTVTLSVRGYQPESFKLQRGVPARVTFVRTTDASCGTEIVLPEYNIKRDLPLNQPIVVEFTPEKNGEFKFACGMDMLQGKIIVQ